MKRKKIGSPIANGRVYKFDRMMIEAARRAREAQGKTIAALGEGGRKYIPHRD